MGLLLASVGRTRDVSWWIPCRQLSGSFSVCTVCRLSIPSVVEVEVLYCIVIGQLRKC